MLRAACCGGVSCRVMNARVGTLHRVPCGRACFVSALQQHLGVLLQHSHACPGCCCHPLQQTAPAPKPDSLAALLSLLAGVYGMHPGETRVTLRWLHHAGEFVECHEDFSQDGALL